MLLGSLLGGSCLVLFGFDLRKRGLVPAEPAALGGLLCALVLTYAGYQRYSEPAILASLVVATSRLAGRMRLRPLLMLPLIALSLGSLANTLAHLAR